MPNHVMHLDWHNDTIRTLIQKLLAKLAVKLSKEIFNHLNNIFIAYPVLFTI